MPGHAVNEFNEPAGWAHLFRVFPNLWRQRDLIWQLTRREVSQRYRGAYLGTVWSFVNPLLMLAIYTFVFSVFFHARWESQPEGGKGRYFFALSLFAGLLPFTVFAELVGRAPTLILSVPNYVKKVVFPLEVLPVVTLGAALFQSLISVVILVAGALLLLGTISSALPLLIVAYIPLIFLSLGLGWILASLGVYMRDLAQGVVPVIQILTFLTPIFYPLSVVPERYRPYLETNPLTIIVQGFRQALLRDQMHILGTMPWLIWTGLSVLLAAGGYQFFMRTKGGFADVL